jgi:HNH endonuclease
MSISPSLREQVRIRANFACEFCGILEVDVGGLLTLDHFHPKSKGGEDSSDNLLYCCIVCNQFKQNYWAATSTQSSLWNPRREPASTHFLELETGQLFPLTPTGEFTINQLRLNRAPLVLHRLKKRRAEEDARLLEQQKDAMEILRQLSQQLENLVEEQQQLLRAQRQLLIFLLRRGRF